MFLCSSIHNMSIAFLSTSGKSAMPVYAVSFVERKDQKDELSIQWIRPTSSVLPLFHTCDNMHV
jgi:hypothetical protein